MPDLINGKRLTVTIDEDKYFQGQPLYMAVLDKLKESGIAGATATRAIAGFTAGSPYHSANSEYLMTGLAIIIEAIDETSKIDMALQIIKAMPDVTMMEATPIMLIAKKTPAPDA
jgi:PII-like signaling protein